MPMPLVASRPSRRPNAGGLAPRAADPRTPLGAVARAAHAALWWAVLAWAALAAPVPGAQLGAQEPFERVVAQLDSRDTGARLRAARLLKESAYPEAAVPLAKVVTDPDAGVQFEAIAAELNIFLADKVVPKKRVGFVVEVRNTIAAEACFTAGPLTLGPRPVPAVALSALRTASMDHNARVGLEALYALGTLGYEPVGVRRRELLATSGPNLAAMIGVPDVARRAAAVRVIGRLYAVRPGDPPIDPVLGDAVISALNDKDRAVRGAAMQALGAMRYERAVEGLTALFKFYAHGDLGVESFDALARIAHESSVPLFSSELGSKNAAFKAIAIEGLTRRGERAKLAEIEAAMKGERSDAVLLAGDFATVRLGSGTLDLLMDALAQPRERDRARDYLVEIAPGHVQLFTRYMQDPDPRTKADVADILGLAGDPAALPVLQPLVRDPNTQVARAAQRASARLDAGRPAQ